TPLSLWMQRNFLSENQGENPMKSTKIMLATVVAIGLGIGASGATRFSEKEVCVMRSPETARQNVGYELIDILRRTAWVTTDWTLLDYAAFSPGLTAPNWLKNDPREGFGARAAVLRSPGCEADGEFTYQTMFGRTFFHIADLVELNAEGLTKGVLKEARVSKHHRLEFEAGQSVWFLVSPDGERYVRVNRPVDAAPDFGAFPDDWFLDKVTLSTPWAADLVGIVQVLRLGNGTSFQGPVKTFPRENT
ncbi:MAG: hypothetical protein AAFN59_11510, partial [Pseudomonadota bacterium]